MNPLARLAAASATAAALALGAVALPADARPARADRPRPIQLEGTVLAEPDGSLDIEVTRASRPARQWLGEATEATIALDGSRTRFSAPLRLVRAASDLRVGDTVAVVARLAADGTATAARVNLRLLSFEGVADAADATSLAVTWADANRTADAWLADNLDPAAVGFAVTDSTRFDDDVVPVAGDEVEVLARVSDADPAALDAVAVEVEEPEA